MTIRFAAAVTAGVIPVLAASCFASGPAQTPEPVNWRSAKPLQAEVVGRPVGQVSVKPLEQVPIPGRNEYIQLIWYKMEARLAELSHVASLNLTTGTIKTHAPLIGQGVWRTVTAGNKLYLGTLTPGHLAVYDPATDTLTDLGKGFPKGPIVYSLAAGPDGSVAMGAGGSSEVALYNPSTRTIRQYGEVGRPQTGFLYYISQDARYIYAVPRGGCPWDLIAIDKATGARNTLLTVPAEGYINLSGSTVTATNHTNKPGEVERRYEVRDGRLIPAAAPARGHRSSSPAYEVAIDKRNSGAGGRVNILYRKTSAGKGSGEWLSRPFTVGVEAMPITRLAAVGPAQIVGTTGPYGPMFLYDISRNGTRGLGYPSAMNAFSIAKIGNSVYLSGYPSTEFAVADLNRAFTMEEGVGEGQGIPWSDSRANPRQIGFLGKILQGSHTGIGIFEGVDRRIYVVAQRHRHYKGFGVAWYDPQTGRMGEVEDSGTLQQLQISWVTPIEGGRKLAMSTRVQPDETKSAPPPREASILLLDTATGRFLPPLVPLPGVQLLGPIAETAGGMLVGTASPGDIGPSTVYKLDIRTGRTVATRVYGGLICGVSSNHDAPTKSHDFQTGPDGNVWTVFRIPVADAPALVMKIRPSDLGIEFLGTLKGDGIRFLFMGRDVYLSGFPELRRIRNAV